MSKSQTNIESPQYTVKILLLGESSVGKTSLVNRYTNNSFVSNNLLTIGIQVKKIMKHISGKRIRLYMGHRRSIKVSYSTKPVFQRDTSNSQSFQKVQEWLKKIQQNCLIQSLTLTLVGNKIDLQNKRQVTKQDASQFASNHQMKFGQTSAKTSINVDIIIQEMLQQIMKKGLAIMKAKKDNLHLQSEPSRKEEDCCG